MCDCCSSGGIGEALRCGYVDNKEAAGLLMPHFVVVAYGMGDIISANQLLEDCENA